MTYQEKLKDPRWQRKRLEVLERDEWACKYCNNKENTLHVHHIFYFKNRDPWDIPKAFLLTLCERCHDDPEIIDHIVNLISRLLEVIWDNEDMLGGRELNTQLSNARYILK